MADSPTRLLLIRHGEANAAVEQIVFGHRCTGLSELGRRQAQALRDRLKRTAEFGTVDAIYASLMERARETAEIIAPALGDLPIKQDCGVCEIHPGEEADGLTWDEFRERFNPPEVWSPYSRWAPGAETWAELATRAGTRLTELARDHSGETLVVACHGGVVEASLIAFGHIPLRRPFRTYVVNTSITEWLLEPDATEWMLVRYNDAAHLAGL